MANVGPTFLLDQSTHVAQALALAQEIVQLCVGEVVPMWRDRRAATTLGIAAEGQPAVSQVVVHCHAWLFAEAPLTRRPFLSPALSYLAPLGKRGVDLPRLPLHARGIAERPMTQATRLRRRRRRNPIRAKADGPASSASVDGSGTVVIGPLAQTVETTF